MREYRYFLSVLDNLRQRVEANPRDEYEVLRESGLERLLIIDKPSLIARANESIRLTVSFDIAKFDAGARISTVQPLVSWANPHPWR